MNELNSYELLFFNPIENFDPMQQIDEFRLFLQMKVKQGINYFSTITNEIAKPLHRDDCKLVESNVIAILCFGTIQKFD